MLMLIFPRHILRNYSYEARPKATCLLNYSPIHYVVLHEKMAYSAILPQSGYFYPSSTKIMAIQRGFYDVLVSACAKYPYNIAVKYYDNGLYKTHTYSELYGVCEYLSQNLQQLECDKTAIAVVSERNHLIPCIVAAAHKCCLTFMFIDPTKNVEELCTQISFPIIVTIQPGAEKKDAQVLFGKKPAKSLSIYNLQINFYCNNIECSETSNYKKWQAKQHSFIALTSGSTGAPKHIEVPVRSILPNITDLTKMFNITTSDNIYFSTPLTFDPSMVEILLASMNGASLIIAPSKASILFSKQLENSITVWQTTPSKFFQFSNADIRNTILGANSTLKILALGGEPFNGLNRLRLLKDINNNTDIFTLYGVTEMSCWACAAKLDLSKPLSDREVPLGKCLSETEIIITPAEEKMKAGKILLVSKTRECYVLNQTNGPNIPNSIKFVDTGDFGVIKHGTIYYRGRKDDVIKRFGNKVFLQLIEATIMSCSKVKTCSCIWLPKPTLLVVYFSSENLRSQELSDYIKCQLDETHWPDRVIRVDNLPTNYHGKISKSVLTKMYENTVREPQTIQSQKNNLLNELKITLGRSFTFKQIQDLDFFALGGTSFLAVTMSNRLSMICPKLGNFILPYLMSPKHSIGEILDMAQKEMFCLENPKPVKQLKRIRTKSGSLRDNASSPNKSLSVSLSHNQFDFIVLWSYDTGKCVDASPTLFQSGPNLFMVVGSHSGKIVIFEAIGGYLQGVLKIHTRVEAPVLCYRESKTSSRGIVGGHDGTVVCFTLEECREIWRINIGSMIKSKAVLCDDIVYIASYDGIIRGIDIASGAVKQTIQIDEQAISANLVAAKNEYILVGTLSGVCASVHAASNTVAWRITVGSPVFASPVIYDDDKYVVFTEVNGVLHCHTVEKGIMIWKFQGTKGNIFSSLYIKGEKSKWQIVFGCHDNKVYSITIKNHVNPSLQWKTTLKSPVYSTPCALSSRLILAASNNGKLCVMESETGTIIAEHSLPGETFSSPAVYCDHIFIGCRDDHVYSLKTFLEPESRKYTTTKLVNFHI